MDPSKTNPEAGKLILHVVENQIRENNPPETRQTINRLSGEGHTAEDARRLVAMVVAVEIFHLMRDKEEFNRERFLRNLAKLSREPWEEEENESDHV